MINVLLTEFIDWGLSGNDWHPQADQSHTNLSVCQSEESQELYEFVMKIKQKSKLNNINFSRDKKHCKFSITLLVLEARHADAVPHVPLKLMVTSRPPLLLY